MKMRNFRSSGAKVLQDLRALNERVHQQEDGSTPKAHHGLEFGKIILPLADGTSTVDSCFEPIRAEVRNFARMASIEKSKSVMAVLAKLLAAEKAKRNEREDANPLPTRGYVTQDFGRPEPAAGTSAPPDHPPLET